MNASTDAVPGSFAALESLPQPGPGVDTVPESQWNLWLDQFADGNFYQTWAYGAAVWGRNRLSHLTLQAEGRPAVLAQFRIVRVPVLGAGVAYLRWGPCCRSRQGAWDPVAFRRALDAAVEEYARRRRLLVRVIPNIMFEDPHAEEALAILRGCGFTEEASVPAYRTIRVDLGPDPATIRRRLDGKWRNQLNAAERNGLSVLEGTGDLLYGQFLKLYDEMMARKQFHTSVDPLAFRRIQQILPEPQKMLIMISTRDGVPLNALVATAVGESAIYLLGATSTEGMTTKGAYLLQWLMMNRLRERGCRWYDLGGINPEANPGVYHFKRGMGGQECRQLGRFSASAGFLSPSVVATAERLRSILARINSRRRAAAANSDAR